MPPCAAHLCDEAADTCKACVRDADCDNGLYCDGRERCDGDICTLGHEVPCAGQVCDEPRRACSDGEADVRLELDPSTTYQTIVGWEGTAQVGQQSRHYLSYKERLLTALVDDLGVTRVRVEVRSGAEHPQDAWQMLRDGELDQAGFQARWYTPVNDDADPQHANPGGFHWSAVDYTVDNLVIPLRQRLKARGQKLFVNLCYVDFRKSEHHAHDDPQEYAEFMTELSKHLRDDKGVTVDAWEIILEPDNMRHSSHYDGKTVGRNMVALGARLKAAGFEPAFVAPSTMLASRADDYFDGIASVPGALKYMRELSYHRYDDGYRTFDEDAALGAIWRRARKYGLQTAMLERTETSAAALHADLTKAHVSSWQQYALAFPGTKPTQDKDIYYYVDDQKVTAISVGPTPTAKLLRQYFNFVRPGAVRFAVRGGGAQYQATAFRNPDDDVVVVVHATQAGRVRVDGLPARVYGINFSTPERFDQDLPYQQIGAGQSLLTEIPAAGVITIYGH